MMTTRMPTMVNWGLRFEFADGLEIPGVDALQTLAGVAQRPGGWRMT
jgi:hypothetical protein